MADSLAVTFETMDIAPAPPCRSLELFWAQIVKIQLFARNWRALHPMKMYGQELWMCNAHVCKLV